MRTTIIFFALLLSSVTLYSQNTKDQKAISVIEKAIEAKGGKALLESITTLYSNSETVMDGRNVNWVTKEMAPNKGSFEIIYQGRVVYKSFYDGTTGYDVINGQKKLADPESFKDKNYRKHIINELDYLDPTLYTLEYMGEEKVDKITCDKVKATLVNGKVKVLYYDRSTGNPVKYDVIKDGEKNTYSTVLYSNFKKYGDLVNETIQTFLSEGDAPQKVKLVEMYYNKKITEADFK